MIQEVIQLRSLYAQQFIMIKLYRPLWIRQASVNSGFDILIALSILSVDATEYLMHMQSFSGAYNVSFIFRNLFRIF